MLNRQKILSANISDIDWMVMLSYKKRLSYQKAQPIFWKMANNSNQIQHQYFNELLNDHRIYALKTNDHQAFLIAKIIDPPEVYDAGKTLMIDDFCVSKPSLWMTHGKLLIDEVVKQSKQQDVKQILVVSGNHDRAKNKFLSSLNLNVMSRWYSKKLS